MGRLRNKKVLLTCGPTWVPLDDMRVLSNKSSGTFGRYLTEELIQAGAQVTVLQGPITLAWGHPEIKARILKFQFFDELLSLFKKELKKKYSMVVHAAAVSDYHVKKPVKGKINSDLKKLKVELVRTPKLINQIKKLRPDTFLVGFKLETNISSKNIKAKTKKLFQEAHCDLVVGNSLHKNRYEGYLIDQKGAILSKALSRKKMAEKLVETLEEFCL